MKFRTLLIAAVAILTFALTSCSQCYDCTYEVEIDNNGTTVTEEVTDEVCTSDQQEIDDRESAGQQCTSSI